MSNRPLDPELAATFERGRLAIQARADEEIADLEARLRAAVCECGGCEFVRGLADAAEETTTTNDKEEAAQ